MEKKVIEEKLIHKIYTCRKITLVSLLLSRESERVIRETEAENLERCIKENWEFDKKREK